MKIILVLIFSLFCNLNCENSENHQNDGLDVEPLADATEKADMEELKELKDESYKIDVEPLADSTEKVDLKELKGLKDESYKIDIEPLADSTEKADLEELKGLKDESYKIDVVPLADSTEKIDVEPSGDATEKNKDNVDICAACNGKTKLKDKEDDKVDKELTEVVDFKINEDESKVKGVINHFPGGNLADLFGTNQHYNIPANYEDFGRRFILQYPYTEKKSVDEEAVEDLHNTMQEYIKNTQESEGPVPIKAPPKFVLAIAKESAILESSKPKNPTDNIIQKDILRSGNYWNDVWKEEIDPKKLLRTGHSKNNLESVKVEIKAGSKLYDLISMLKEKSPRLLYVINKNVE